MRISIKSRFMVDETKKVKLKIKKEYLLIAVLSLGIVIVAIIGIRHDNSEILPVVATETTETEKYVANLEDKLCKTLSAIKGAGNVFVTITVGSGIETVVARDEKTVEENGRKTMTDSVIFVGGQPYVLYEKYPEIVGVAVVSDGADNITVKMALLDAITTVLKVPCNKVQIFAR